tara:strand:+ start:989 stop:1321 length:333 start_codon:yes stop_codon:yes gene_type:complete
MISPGDSTICDFNALFSCDSVLSSSYSQFMGIPVAALGLLWFIIATILAVASFKMKLKRIILLTWAIIGVSSIPLLVYAESLVGAICLLCTLAHILGLTFLGLTFFYEES